MLSARFRIALLAVSIAAPRLVVMSASAQSRATPGVLDPRETFAPLTLPNPVRS